MNAEKGLQGCTDLYKFHLVCFVSCKFLHVIKHSQERVAEVVNHDHTVPVLQQNQHSVAGCKM